MRRALEVRRQLEGVDIAGHYDPSFPHLDGRSSKVHTLPGVNGQSFSVRTVRGGMG